MTVTEMKHQAKLQEWEAAIQDCRGSGMSVKGWCRQRGTSTATYYRWERELLKVAAPGHQPNPVTFAKLPTVPKPQSSVSERIATVRYKDMSLGYLSRRGQ